MGNARVASPRDPPSEDRNGSVADPPATPPGSRKTPAPTTPQAALSRAFVESPLPDSNRRPFLTMADSGRAPERIRTSDLRFHRPSSRARHPPHWPVACLARCRPRGSETQQRTGIRAGFFRTPHLRLRPIRPRPSTWATCRRAFRPRRLSEAGDAVKPATSPNPSPSSPTTTGTSIPRRAIDPASARKCASSSVRTSSGIRDLVEPNVAAGRSDDGWADARPPARHRPPAGEAAPRAHRITYRHLPDVRAWGSGHARSSWNPTASSAPPGRVSLAL
jgi:hypothetical protein